MSTPDADQSWTDPLPAALAALHTQHVVLVGPSGSGKTTTLRAIQDNFAGPRSASTYLFDHDVAGSFARLARLTRPMPGIGLAESIGRRLRYAKPGCQPRLILLIDEAQGMLTHEEWVDAVKQYADDWGNRGLRFVLALVRNAQSPEAASTVARIDAFVASLQPAWAALRLSVHPESKQAKYWTGEENRHGTI